MDVMSGNTHTLGRKTQMNERPRAERLLPLPGPCGRTLLWLTCIPSVKPLIQRPERCQKQEMRHYFRDRKSTRLNSSHLVISYAVFCLKKKKKKEIRPHYHIQYLTEY